MHTESDTAVRTMWKQVYTHLLGNTVVNLLVVEGVEGVGERAWYEVWIVTGEGQPVVVTRVPTLKQAADSLEALSASYVGTIRQAQRGR